MPLWRTMTATERKAVVDALPSDIESTSPPEGDPHRIPKQRALEALDAFFKSNQECVTGQGRIRLTAGQAVPAGKSSPFSLYSERLATYSAKDQFDRTAAEGFMKIWGLPYEGMKKKT